MSQWRDAGDQLRSFLNAENQKTERFFSQYLYDVSALVEICEKTTSDDMKAILTDSVREILAQHVIPMIKVEPPNFDIKPGVEIKSEFRPTNR